MNPLRMLAESNPVSMTDRVQKALENAVQNKYVIGVVGTLAVAYLARYMPKLPNAVESVVNNIIGHAVMLFIVAMLLTKNPVTSVICTLVVLIVVLGSKLVFGNNENMRNVAQQEGRLIEYAPVEVKENVLTEVAPLSSETVTEKVSEVTGYSNLWMNNGEVEPEEVEQEVEAPVAAAPTVTNSKHMSSTAMSSVAAPVSVLNMSGMGRHIESKLLAPSTGVSANVLPSEINPSAIEGVMSAKQTKLASL